jgi:hypothetical protein
MHARASAAVAAPRLTMKLACLSEIAASPTRYPLRPAASMSAPAVVPVLEAPDGFRNVLPQDGDWRGWV